MRSPDSSTSVPDLELESPVRGSSLRSAFEWTGRVIAILSLAFLIWQSIHALRAKLSERVTGAQLRSALARWSTRASPGAIHVVLDSVPQPELRDWLAALRKVGTETSWEGPKLGATALNVEPVVDPMHSARIWIAAPSASGLLVRDEVGAIDSARVRASGSVLTTPHVSGIVTAAGGNAIAAARLPDSVVVKPVLLIGIASWEGKFVLASLEERGWTVDARLGIGPGNEVVQARAKERPAAVIDTARYSAVIALDSSAARYARSIGEYVRAGGGFIAAGPAAALPAFAGLMPGATQAPTLAGSFDIDSANPRRALQLMPIAALKPGAIALEMRDTRTAIAARRIERGRVLQVGYLDTWRWRMGGLDENPSSAYRSWWSGMVSSVAYGPRVPRPAESGAVSTEPTPLASLVGSLGEPRLRPDINSSLLGDPRLLPVLFAILMAALFFEWASRRLRGRP